MAKYRICFSVAGEIGGEIIFEASAGVSYEDAAGSIDKDALAEKLSLALSLVTPRRTLRSSRLKNLTLSLEVMAMRLIDGDALKKRVKESTAILSVKVSCGNAY